jgi:hypothetical protein
MFINNIKFIKNPKVTTSSSPVWLNGIDGLYGFLPHTTHFSVTTNFVFCGTRKNGKVNVPKRARRVSPDTHQMVSQMVERASQIVNNIANHQWNPKGNVDLPREIVSTVTRMRVISEGDTITINSGCDPLLKVKDVLFGPL